MVGQNHHTCSHEAVHFAFRKGNYREWDQSKTNVLLSRQQMFCIRWWNSAGILVQKTAYSNFLFPHLQHFPIHSCRIQCSEDRLERSASHKLGWANCPMLHGTRNLWGHCFWSMWSLFQSCFKSQADRNPTWLCHHLLYVKIIMAVGTKHLGLSETSISQKTVYSENPAPAILSIALQDLIMKHSM